MTLPNVMQQKSTFYLCLKFIYLYCLDASSVIYKTISQHCMYLFQQFQSWVLYFHVLFQVWHDAPGELERSLYEHFRELLTESGSVFSIVRHGCHALFINYKQ